MKRNKLSKEELENLLEEFGSVGKVASSLSIPYSTIYYWYKSYNIELPPSCMTIYEELRAVGLSNQQKSVIVGSVLGDGSLLKQRHSKNARLQIGHCTKQLGYLKWKKRLLDPFVKTITLAELPGNKIINGKNSFSTGYYIINTISHSGINDYFDRYYINGKKRVSLDVIDELDWLAVAIWLCDDGSFTFRSDSYYSLRSSIATCSFDLSELEILKTALSKFYTGKIRIEKYNNTLVLGGGSDHINNFLNKICEIVPECIHYKLAPQRLHVKPHKVGEDIVRTHRRL